MTKLLIYCFAIGFKSYCTPNAQKMGINRSFPSNHISLEFQNVYKEKEFEHVYQSTFSVYKSNICHRILNIVSLT